MNVRRCIRKAMIIDQSGRIGPRENPEAWCGKRFDAPCSRCDGSGKASKEEKADTGIAKCGRCHGRRIEPIGDNEPISLNEAIASRGRGCAACLVAIAEAATNAA